MFLTKAQDEIVKNYFNPKSKGNNTQEGFDDSQKRQIDFSMLTTVMTEDTDFASPLFDVRDNTKSVSLPEKLMMAIYEQTLIPKRGKGLPDFGA